MKTLSVQQPHASLIIEGFESEGVSERTYTGAYSYMTQIPYSETQERR